MLSLFQESLSHHSHKKGPVFHSDISNFHDVYCLTRYLSDHLFMNGNPVLFNIYSWAPDSCTIRPLPSLDHYLAISRFLRLSIRIDSILLAEYNLNKNLAESCSRMISWPRVMTRKHRVIYNNFHSLRNIQRLRIAIVIVTVNYKL